MNELTVQSQTISSFEIAEMMEVSHRDVMRKIDGSTDRKGYIEILGEAQMGVTDYFIKSTYLTDQNKELSCYLITKMGCEFLANKFTGEKGVIFSAKYVKRFNEMEQHIQNPSLTYSNLSPQLQLLINIETQQKQQELALIDTNKRIDNMQDVIALDTTTWRKSAKDLISKIALKMGGFDYIREVNTEINKLVNLRCGVSLEIRLTNKRRRMAEEGICKSKRDKLTKVDIIAEDKKLIEVYVAIVKEMAVKNGVAVSELKSA